MNEEQKITLVLTSAEAAALVSAASEQAQRLERLAQNAIRADMAALAGAIIDRAKLLDALAGRLIKLLPDDTAVAVAVAVRPGGDYE